MKINLTHEEALVLFEWLSKHSRQDDLFQDKSEQYVLWNIECQLEKELPDPHSGNYHSILMDARDMVKRNY